MDKIELTKDEKRVLKLAEIRYDKQPEEFSTSEYASLVRSLKRRGFVDAVLSMGDRVSILWLTDYGEEYLRNQPKIESQITKDDIRKFFKDVKTIIAIAVGIITILGVLLACVRLV